VTVASGGAAVLPSLVLQPEPQMALIRELVTEVRNRARRPRWLGAATLRVYERGAPVAATKSNRSRPFMNLDGLSE
jgi:hypothetical protein